MITIISEPSAGQTLQDDLYHVLASDASGTTDMRFVFDVFVNSVQKIRVKQYPNPETGKAYFDASTVARNSVNYEWFSAESLIYPSGQPSANGDVFVEYLIQYGEDVSGVTTSNMASGEVRALNYLAPLFKRRQLNLEVDKKNKFLTNRPKTAKASLTDNLFVGFYTEDAFDDLEVKMVVKKYGYDNSLLGTQAIGEVAAYNGFIQMNIGPGAVNDSIAGGFIDANVKYYVIDFNPDDVITVETFTVYLECNRKYTPVNLHFLSAWGMFDTAKFGLVSRLNLETTQKGFEKSDVKYTNSGVSYYEGNQYNESKINYAIEKNWTLKLTMDAPNDNEADWLSELISSAKIYAEIDGWYYPVTMKTTAYEYSKYVNNRLRALEIEVEFNQTRYSHRR